MPRKKRCKVFVSYSRRDEELVRPLAGLLGVAANDAVFLDVASIKPGDVWKSELERALREAPVFENPELRDEVRSQRPQALRSLEDVA